MSLLKDTIIALVLVLGFALIVHRRRDWLVVQLCPREILMLDDAEERRRVNALGSQALMRRGKTWVGILGYILGVLIVSGLLTGLIFDSPQRVCGVPARQISIVLAIVMPMALIPIALIHYRRWMRVFLRHYLNEHGIPVCRNCGYDLRGQVDPRCPECGADSGLTNAAKE